MPEFTGSVICGLADSRKPAFSGVGGQAFMWRGPLCPQLNMTGGERRRIATRLHAILNEVENPPQAV